MNSVAHDAHAVGAAGQFEHESPVPSPCVSVCRMNSASGLCEGCWRTLDEIAAWSKMDDDAKRGVWACIGLRRGQGERVLQQG